MEILSIGEKIKRARIYKGFTLKDLCNGKISISKMSCIENNKVSLDQDVLEYIAEKLDADINYLKEDIEEQIIRNISEPHQLIGNAVDFEKDMIYNLEVSERYGFFNSAFNIVHLLFSYFFDKGLLENIEVLLSKYYELYLKSDNEINKMIYNLDLGRFLFINKEYNQAINYYSNVRLKLSELDYQKSFFIKATLEESRCYLMLKDYEKAFEIGSMLLNYTEYVKDDNYSAEIYHHVAIIMLRNNNSNYEKLEEKANKCENENYFNKADAMLDYAIIFFDRNDKPKALEFLKKGIELYPVNDKVKFTRFIMKNVCLLIENDEIELAGIYCEDSLNFAIALDNDELIEKNYYYKSLILYKQNDFISAEMYINLSLDVLTKFGKRQDIYTRYMEIGTMYYQIGATSDSLKYFSLAIALEKKI